MRLGVYTDLAYRREGDELSSDLAFSAFVCSLPPRVEEVVLFGRLDPEPGRFPHPLPRAGVRFVPLPHYGSVRDLRGVVGSLGRARRTFAAELDRLDLVWLFGPHPLALEFARVARQRGVPVVLGVRQDFPRYVANRLPGRGWAWAIPAAHALELAFRWLGRRAPAVVVGDALQRKYAGGAPVLATGFSLIRPGDLVGREEALARADAWEGKLRLLSVSRLDPEKNPLLLAEVAARLPERWHLTVVGSGPLEPELRARACERLELAGYVPAGPGLWARYQAAQAFLHVSWTEGLPQVLFEAQAAGLPVVATDVGGVRAAVEGSALLVPPGDAGAPVRALERLAAEPELRRSLVEAGLANAARETMDAQLDRIGDFLRAAAGGPGGRRSS